MTAGNTNYDTLLSTTLDNYRDTFDDNLSKDVVTYHFLKKNGRVKTLSGGAKIVEPLMYGSNSTAKTYSLYDSLDYTPQDGMTAAEFEWRQHAVTVIIAGIEEAKNSGPEAVIDLLDAKVQQAEISAIQSFDVMFNGDGTGNSGKNFLGLGALIGDASSSITTVGGIDASDSDNAWWRSYIKRSVGALNLEDMQRAFYGASRGTVSPEWGQTTLDVFLEYNALLQANQRFTDPKTAEAGFQNLTFHGKPIVWGPNVPSGTLTFANSKFLRLNKLGDTWLKPSKFRELEGKDARSSRILSYGQLTISNRKLGGSRLEDITTS